MKELRVPAGDELHPRRSGEPEPLVFAQASGDIGGLRALQANREREGVLDGLTRALPGVDEHRTCGIAERRDSAVPVGTSCPSVLISSSAGAPPPRSEAGAGRRHC
ncbi:hypothetical protein, partial [Amycolatopsis pithecellobii]|uniref:hypothetical protein n=1 Tax=Amycolatopsis pithecellobii TaxID=664692 RepID=UPI001AA0A86C